MTPRTRVILKDSFLQLALLAASGIVTASLPHPYDQLWPAVLFLVMLLSLAIWYFPRRRP